jgi:hypothetical protein
MGMFGKLGNGNSTSNTSLKERLADTIGDLKAGKKLGASKDMLQVARDSQETMGSTLNAQKADKGNAGQGTYKYKTDALIKMLDGVLKTVVPQDVKFKAGGVKAQSAQIMQRMRETALKYDNFKQGMAVAVAQEMAGYRNDPLLGATSKKVSGAQAALRGQELKILEEVLTTLGTRMSPDSADKYGLKKNRPTDRDGSDRSDAFKNTIPKKAQSEDADEINAARMSRVYHAKLGHAVKNMGGALKETARSTGAALRNYTEPVRRDLAIGGLQTAKGAAQAAEQAAKAARYAKEQADLAQAHVVGAAWGTAKGLGLATAKAGKDLGKSTLRTAEAIAKGTGDVLVHGAQKAKKAHGAQVAKAQARKGSSRAAAAEAPQQAAPAQQEAAPARVRRPLPRPPVARVAPQGPRSPNPGPAPRNKPAADGAAEVPSTITERTEPLSISRSQQDDARSIRSVASSAASFRTALTGEDEPSKK